MLASGKEVQPANISATSDSSSVLVPLTNSLYVRGEISDSDRVLVDVGTGFLVDKVGQDTHSQTPTSKVSPIIACLQKLKSAEQFYNAKVEELSTNLKDLENVIQRKQTNARTVEEGTSHNFQGRPYCVGTLLTPAYSSAPEDYGFAKFASRSVMINKTYGISIISDVITPRPTTSQNQSPGEQIHQTPALTVGYSAPEARHTLSSAA
jgi:prefoldin subunit 5